MENASPTASYAPPSRQELFAQPAPNPLAQPPVAPGMPNMSVGAPAHTMVPVDPNAPVEYPHLPASASDPQGAYVLNSDARHAQDAQAAAAEQKAKEEKARAIFASPLSKEAQHAELAKLFASTPNANGQPQQTPIDLETASGINNFASDQYEDNIQGVDALSKSRANTARSEANLNLAETKARAPLDHQYAEFQQGQYAALQQLEKDQAAKQQEAMARYQQTNDEMHKIAVARPTDLFGQAGINGILGRISMFLGGAGTNGNHENRNLQFIQDLANRNIAKQERNWSHLQAAGQQDNTVYGMIRTQTQDAVAAASVMHNMYLSTYQAHLKDMANAYASPRTKVALQKELDNISAQKLALDDGFAQHLTATGLQTLNAAGASAAATNQLQVKFMDQAHEESLRQEEQSLPGFDGVATKDRHAALSKFQAGGGAIVSGLSEIEKVLTMAKGGKYDKSRLIATIQNNIKGNARDFYQTGTKLEGPEVGQISTVATSYIEDIVALLSGGADPSRIIPKINAVKHEIRRAVATTILNGQKGLKINLQDPFWDNDNPMSGPRIGDESDGSVGSTATNLLKTLAPMRTINALSGSGEK